MKTIVIQATLLLSLALFTACPSAKNQVADAGPETIVLQGVTIISIMPDSLQLERLKSEWGEESFYVYADDQIWYEDQLVQKAKLSDITLVQTQNKNLILTDHQNFRQQIDTASLQDDWGHYFYYRPDKGLLQMSLDELLEQLETEKPTAQQVGILLENVATRKEPGFNQPEDLQLKAGQTVYLKNVTQVDSGQEDENAFCYQNTWVRIRTEDDREGWVFGKSVGKIVETSDLVADYSGFQVMLDDEIYNVLLVGNYTIGASVEAEGLTGCEEYYPIVFMRNYYQNLEMIQVSGASTSDYPFCRLLSDESGEEKITAAETQGDYVRFYVNVNYQEGSGSYVLEIKRENGLLVGEVKNDQRGLE